MADWLAAGELRLEWVSMREANARSEVRAAPSHAANFHALFQAGELVGAFGEEMAAAVMAADWAVVIRKGRRAMAGNTARAGRFLQASGNPTHPTRNPLVGKSDAGAKVRLRVAVRRFPATLRPA